jgi:hypothetical protein
MFPDLLEEAAFRFVFPRGDNGTKGGNARSTENKPILFCDPNAEVPTSETANIYRGNFIMTCASCVR